MMRMLGRPVVIRIAQLGRVPISMQSEATEARALLRRYEELVEDAGVIPQWAVSQPLYDAYKDAEAKVERVNYFLNPYASIGDTFNFPGAVDDLSLSLDTWEPLIEETIVLVREASQPPGGVPGFPLPLPPPPGTTPGTPSDPVGTAPAPGAVVGPDGTIVSESTFTKDVLPLGIGLAAVGGALLLLSS